MIEPIKDKVIVKVDTKKEEKTESGIIIKKKQGTANTGEVVESRVEGVEKGETIVYRQFGFDVYQDENLQTYHIVDGDAVIAKLV